MCSGNQTNSDIHSSFCVWPEIMILHAQEKEGDKKAEKDDSGSKRGEEKVREKEKGMKEEATTKGGKEEQKRKEEKEKKDKGKSGDGETELKEKRGDERRK